MGLHFVLGASGSGKSIRMYQYLIKEAIAHPDRYYLILVPDQYTMQIQKQMVCMHPNHVLMNIDVLSFSRFVLLIQYLVPGYILAWAYDRTGNLWGPALLHILANLLQVWLTW